MKYLGLLLFVVGIAIASAAGSRTPPDIHANNIVAGTATMASAATGAAHSAYCEAIAATDAATADGCNDGDALDDEVSVDALRADAPDVDDAAIALRTTWLDALEAERAVSAPKPSPSPGARLSTWFDAHGAPFSGGMALLVLGAFLARRAAASDHQPARTSTGEAVDFGKLLADVEARVRVLSEEAARAETAAAGCALIRDGAASLRDGAITDLVGSRVQVERTYGLAKFAAIFSPLSAGERLVNRAWAAAADEHLPEALASLEGAAAELHAALGEVPS